MNLMNHLATRRNLALLFATGAAAALTLVAAGPLNPLPGAIAPTYKTLGEVEPRTAINSVNTQGDATNVYKIVVSGSYYLTGNMLVPSGKNGIMIAAPNVTIDMGGFVITGVGGSLSGIANNSSANGGMTSVRGGTILNMGARGLDLTAVPNVTVSDMLVQSSGTDGIGLSQYGHLIHCSSYNNGAAGISAGYGSLVESCLAFNNTGFGISAGNGATITDCVASGNAIHGIRITYGCVATNNNVSVNTQAGIDVLFGGNRVEGNTFTNNGIGLKVETSANVIVRNVAKANSINWSIVANNVFGQIVDRTAPASGIVSGNSAASSMGTTDSNANVTF